MYYHYAHWNVCMYVFYCLLLWTFKCLFIWTMTFMFADFIWTVTLTFVQLYEHLWMNFGEYKQHILTSKQKYICFVFRYRKESGVSSDSRVDPLHSITLQRIYSPNLWSKDFPSKSLNLQRIQPWRFSLKGLPYNPLIEGITLKSFNQWNYHQTLEGITVKLFKQSIYFQNLWSKELSVEFCPSFHKIIHPKIVQISIIFLIVCQSFISKGWHESNF